MPLTWRRRRYTEETQIARHVIRESTCGNFRVVEWLPVLESLAGPRFFAMRCAKRTAEEEIWLIVSEHKREERAREACERFSRRHRKSLPLFRSWRRTRTC